MTKPKPAAGASRPSRAAPGRRASAKKAVARVAAGAPFPVVAMAASVGGLNALSVILGGLPAGFPAAIAIVMHLSPDHKSVLAELLGRRTHLTVIQARTGDVLRPAAVFIAPPNHHLSVARGGVLKLSSPVAEKIHHARPSAEPLFASVATVYKHAALAVVLTGGDGDGSFGVRIIKDHGGMVIAQDRPTSVDFSMPETSIKTGDVDFILPLAEIAPRLIAWAASAAGTSPRRGVPRARPALTGVDEPRPYKKRPGSPALTGVDSARPALTGVDKPRPYKKRPGSPALTGVDSARPALTAADEPRPYDNRRELPEPGMRAPAAILGEVARDE